MPKHIKGFIQRDSLQRILQANAAFLDIVNRPYKLMKTWNLVHKLPIRNCQIRIRLYRIIKSHNLKSVAHKSDIPLTDSHCIL